MKLYFRCLILLGLKFIILPLVVLFVLKYKNKIAEKKLSSAQSGNGQKWFMEDYNGNILRDNVHNIPNEQFKQVGGQNNIPNTQNKQSEYVRTFQHGGVQNNTDSGFSRKLQRSLGNDIPREQYMKGLWRSVDDSVNRIELFSEDFNVDVVLDGLRTAKILNVTRLATASALKWILHLEGGAKAVFKPFLVKRNMSAAFSSRHAKKYRCTRGYEDPTAEIGAFHINRILGMRLAPYTVGRYLSLDTEVWPVADNETRETIVKKGNTYCITNKCWSCRHANEDLIVCPKNNKIYGSVKYWINGGIHNFHNGRPMKNRRLYRSAYLDEANGMWMVESNYCKEFRARRPYTELRVFLDVVDSQITDFIISHYDSRYTAILTGSHGNNDSYIFLSVRLDYGLAFCTRMYQPIHGTIQSLYQCCHNDEKMQT